MKSPWRHRHYCQNSLGKCGPTHSNSPASRKRSCPAPRSAQVAAAPGKRFNLKVNSLISFLTRFELLECEAAVQIIASSLLFTGSYSLLKIPGEPGGASARGTSARRTAPHGPRPPVTPAAVGRPRPSRPPRVRKGAPPGSAWHRARHTDSAGFVCEVFGPSGPELKGVTELHGPDLPLKPHPCTRGLEPGAQAPPGTPSLASPRADTLAPAGAAGPPSPAQGTGGAAQTGSRWSGRGGPAARRRAAFRRLASRTFPARPGSAGPRRARGPGGCGRRSPRPARAGRGPGPSRRARACGPGFVLRPARGGDALPQPRVGSRPLGGRPHARRCPAAPHAPLGLRFLPWRRPRGEGPLGARGLGAPPRTPLPAPCSPRARDPAAGPEPALASGKGGRRSPGGRVRGPPGARRPPPALAPRLCPPEPPRTEPRWRGDVRSPDARYADAGDKKPQFRLFKLIFL